MKIISMISAAMMALSLTAASATTTPSNVTAATGTSTPVMMSQNSNQDSAPLKLHPDYRITISSDFGGNIVEYIQKYNLLRQSGSKIMLDDACISACTLITGLIPDENVCATETSFLAFHSAWYGMGQYSEEGTRLLWWIYPEKIKVLMRSLGWDGTEHPNLIYVKGTDLYQRCQ